MTGLAVDANGNVFLTGLTSSPNFPIVNAQGLQQTLGGYFDGYLVKLAPSGSSLVYSTYLGGGGDDSGTRVGLDSAGNVYVTGYTNSLDFPLAPLGGAFQGALGGGYDAFVAKITTGNTSPGNNVLVVPTDTRTGGTPVQITFSTVTNGGDTALTTGTSGPVPPTNSQAGSPLTYYKPTTTAFFSGPVTVCIDYSGTTFTNRSSAKLFNYEGGMWVDRTASLDTADSKICGTVTTLSQMAIFEPVPTGGGGPTPFTSLTARSIIILNPGDMDDRFWVRADAMIGQTSNGVFPLAEPLTLQLGTFAMTIPAGSFVKSGNLSFKFDGTIDGVVLKVRIKSLSLGNFRFYTKGKYADLTGTVHPVPFVLTIGNDSGKVLMADKKGNNGAKIIIHKKGEKGGCGHHGGRDDSHDKDGYDDEDDDECRASDQEIPWDDD